MTGDELKTIFDSVMARPELQPTQNPDGTWVTHCNQSFRLIAQAFDNHDFDNPDMTAQQMGLFMMQHGHEYIPVNGEHASAFAMLGKLVAAFMSAEMLKEVHAHIDTVYPAPTQFSPSLGKNVPMLTNVGLKNKEEKESEAFPVNCGEALYFVYMGQGVDSGAKTV